MGKVFATISRFEFDYEKKKTALLARTLFYLFILLTPVSGALCQEGDRDEAPHGISESFSSKEEPASPNIFPTEEPASPNTFEWTIRKSRRMQIAEKLKDQRAKLKPLEENLEKLSNGECREAVGEAIIIASQIERMEKLINDYAKKYGGQTRLDGGKNLPFESVAKIAPNLKPDNPFFQPIVENIEKLLKSYSEDHEKLSKKKAGMTCGALITEALVHRLEVIKLQKIIRSLTTDMSSLL